MTLTKKEIFSVPNILSYFRIVLVPVFVYNYLKAELPTDYYIAGGIIVISGLTDFLDGFIARKYNMITELGKALDPVADKFTQAAIALCLMIKIPQMLRLAAVFVVKESLLGISATMLLFKHNKKMDGAKWFGKVSTFVFYIVTIILLLFPMIDGTVEKILIDVATACMFGAFVLYIPVFGSMWDAVKNPEGYPDEQG